MYHLSGMLYSLSYDHYIDTGTNDIPQGIIHLFFNYIT